MERLRQAPVIIGQLDNTSVIDAAASRIRQDFDGAPTDNGELKKIDGDVWAINGPLGLHRDGTAPRHRVFGIVLINEPDLVLFTQRDQIYDIPVGTIYHIDGRRTHGALSRNGVMQGMFGFLAWDVPGTVKIQELIDDLIPSLTAFGNREQRINVLP